MNRCFYFLSQGATTTGNTTSTTTAYDTVKVQVLNTSGTVLATLATYSNLDKEHGLRPEVAEPQRLQGPDHPPALLLRGAQAGLQILLLTSTM